VMGVLKQLRSSNLRTASLLVKADNRRAVRVYRDVGFEVVEEAPSDPRTNERLLLMRKRLHEDDGEVIPIR
jgi:ribosomal protein S18 acetylase RimI-like enzyme